MTYYRTEADIANAALDLIDEIIDVVDPEQMHRIVMHRFRAQPEAMAQVTMCLAIWASEVNRGDLDEISSRRALERLRDRLPRPAVAS